MRKKSLKNSKTVLSKFIFFFILFYIIAIKILPQSGIYEFFFDRAKYPNLCVDIDMPINDLNQLSPHTKKLALKFLQKADEEGLPVEITETYRPQERQNYLYEKGRTKKGPKVTWTKHSKHTDRRAFDIKKRGKDPYGDDEFFKRCAEIGKEIGLTPGYYFKKYQDKPHFEFRAWWLSKNY